MSADTECPYCEKEIHYNDIMSDSDWDDQGEYKPYETVCPHCGESIIITQIDIRIERDFFIEKRGKNH